MKSLSKELFIWLVVISCHFLLNSCAVRGTTGLRMELDELFKHVVNGEVIIPAGTYNIDKTLILEGIDRDTRIRGEGRVVINSSVPLLKASAKIVAKGRMSRDAFRGDSSIHFIESHLISKGDIISFSNETVVETAWNTPQYFTSRVKYIARDGSVIIEDELTFDFLVEDSSKFTVYKKAEISIENIAVRAPSFVKGNKLFDFVGLSIKTKDLHTSVPDDGNYDHVHARACVNNNFEGTNFRGGRYGYLLNYCSRSQVSDVHADYTHHAVAPASWSNWTTVDGYSGVSTAPDGHPSFNVTYRNVNINLQGLNPNCRALGVRFENCIFTGLSIDESKEVYFGPLSLRGGFKDLYKEYDITFTNVDYVGVLGKRNGLSFSQGRRLKIEKCRTHLISTKKFFESITIQDSEVGAFYCYDSNFEIRDCTFNARLQNSKIIQPPLSCSYSGTVQVSNTNYINYDGSCLFKYVHDPKTRFVFEGVDFSSISCFTLATPTKKLFSKVIFTNCRSNENRLFDDKQLTKSESH